MAEARLLADKCPIAVAEMDVLWGTGDKSDSNFITDIRELGERLLEEAKVSLEDMDELCDNWNIIVAKGMCRSQKLEEILVAFEEQMRVAGYL